MYKVMQQVAAVQKQQQEELADRMRVADAGHSSGSSLPGTEVTVGVQVCPVW
jgi:hypothetical protein